MYPFIRAIIIVWQYTSGGSVDGIEGKVDFNLSYLKIENSVPDVVQKKKRRSIRRIFRRKRSKSRGRSEERRTLILKRWKRSGKSG